MFARLVGSAPVHQHSVGSTSVSIVMHAAIVALSVVFTARTVTAHEKLTPETIFFRRTAPEPAPRPVSRAATTCGPCLPPRMPSHLSPPDIPIPIPTPDTPTLPPDIGGGWNIGIPTVAESACADCGDFPTAPEIPARPLPGNPQPVYPSLLRASRIEGVIAAHFVVDSTGRVDPRQITFDLGGEVLFERAVRRALLDSRYEPARTGGRAVAMRVEQSFTFRITP